MMEKCYVIQENQYDAACILYAVFHGRLWNSGVQRLWLRQYSFGEYNGKEKIISSTDCGETYHIVTDVSYASFTDNSGSTYEYTTQEYDVEKETLRILDTFRTYTFTNSSGESKTCTLSRSLTYGKKDL